MGFRNRNCSRYIFSTPYHRDSRLIAKPLYTTTHETSYPYHNNGKYDHIVSKYKKDLPFIKSSTKNIYRGIHCSLRPHVPYVGRKR